MAFFGLSGNGGLWQYGLWRSQHAVDVGVQRMLDFFSLETPLPPALRLCYPCPREWIQGLGSRQRPAEGERKR